jgi:hypothetical protein
MIASRLISVLLYYSVLYQDGCDDYNGPGAAASLYIDAGESNVTIDLLVGPSCTEGTSR